MIEDALQCIPPDERETWVRAGMAIKSELGDSGFSVWDEWSRQSPSYRTSDAKSVWRSIKPFGGITIRSLYAEARRYGWGGSAPSDAIQINRDQIKKERAEEEAKERRRNERAALDAEKMIKNAVPGPHEYLDKKGFSHRHGLTLNGKLLVPMRSVSGEITGLQLITPSGDKKFLPGTKAKGSVFMIGQSGESWLCEGYATALSLLDALKSLHRTGRVIVTFSAANLAYVAGMIKGRRYVIADHDESGTGEKYARKTELPWWMPPSYGDANDYHQQSGIRALAVAMNTLRRNG